MQFVLVAQDTPASELLEVEAGPGLGTIDQTVPFQRSMSRGSGNWRWMDCPPTATQSEAFTHFTAESALLPRRFGLGTIVQAAPFHCSIRLFPVPV